MSRDLVSHFVFLIYKTKCFIFTYIQDHFCCSLRDKFGGLFSLLPFLLIYKTICFVFTYIQEEHPTTHFSKSVYLCIKRLFYWIYPLNNSFWRFYFCKKVFTTSKPAELFPLILPAWRRKGTPFEKMKYARYIVTAVFLLCNPYH